MESIIPESIIPESIIPIAGSLETPAVVQMKPTFNELIIRIQCLEVAISRIPIVGQDYAMELRRVGLKKLGLKKNDLD